MQDAGSNLGFRMCCSRTFGDVGRRRKMLDKVAASGSLLTFNTAAESEQSQSSLHRTALCFHHSYVFMSFRDKTL